jgi:hypothetical protein
MVRKMTLVAGLLTLAFALAAPPASAGGNMSNGTKNKNINGYHCKSGKVARGPKGCKENGGHL